MTNEKFKKLMLVEIVNGYLCTLLCLFMQMTKKKKKVW